MRAIAAPTRPAAGATSVRRRVRRAPARRFARDAAAASAPASSALSSSSAPLRIVGGLAARGACARWLRRRARRLFGSGSLSARSARRPCLRLARVPPWRRRADPRLRGVESRQHVALALNASPTLPRSCAHHAVARRDDAHDAAFDIDLAARHRDEGRGGAAAPRSGSLGGGSHRTPRAPAPAPRAESDHDNGSRQLLRLSPGHERRAARRRPRSAEDAAILHREDAVGVRGQARYRG